MAAGWPSPFSLDEKGPKNQAGKNLPRSGQNTLARFSGRPLPAFVHGVFNAYVLILIFPQSAEKLRAKSGKTVVGGAAAGAYNICEAVAPCVSAIFAAPGFT
jgi:hypothetical protein